MKLFNKLEKSISFWFLLGASVIFFLLRLPSLFEPYWYGDEGIYEVIGFALRHGRLLYTGIWDNKPPVLYLIYALFDGDQSPVKLLSLLTGIVGLVTLYFLSKKLFSKNTPSFITVGLFTILFGLPLIEGNIANAENFMLPLGILAGYITFLVAQEKIKMQQLWLFIAGLLVGVPFITKIVGIFDFAAFLIFLFIISLSKITIQNIVKSVIKILPLAIGFLIPLIICVGFFILHGTFSDFLHSTLLSNVSYVNYGNKFIIPQGFLILKTLLLAGVILFFLIKRKHFAPATLFIYIWLVFSVYSALFSQRPYTHYMLVLVPSFCLLVGSIFANKKERIVSLIITALLVVFVYKSFSFYNKSLSYYTNFVSYVTNHKTEFAYQSFFDRVTPRDYAIAQFVSANKNPDDKIFIWGNSGQIYKLTSILPIGRFIVAYHMTMTKQNFIETHDALIKNPPRYIIVLPNQSGLPYSLIHYKEKFIIDNATIYEHII